MSSIIVCFKRIFRSNCIWWRIVIVVVVYLSASHKSFAVDTECSKMKKWTAVFSWVTYRFFPIDYEKNTQKFYGKPKINLWNTESMEKNRLLIDLSDRLAYKENLWNRSIVASIASQCVQPYLWLICQNSFSLLKKGDGENDVVANELGAIEVYCYEQKQHLFFFQT